MPSFELIESLSLPGDPEKPNEDAFGLLPDAALVMDGATGLSDSLMPGRSDAAWLAQFGVRRLLAHLKDGETPRTAVRRAMEDAETSFGALRRRPPSETYEIPFASMMLLAPGKSGFEALWFGDCAVLIKRPGAPVTIVGDTLLKRELEAARAASAAAAHGLAPAVNRHRPEYLAALRRGRNLVNTERGGWLFGPDPRASEHASVSTVELPTDTLLLLVTDGFLALVSDYRRYDPETLLAASLTSGLEPLGRQLREIEAADVEGTRYPRFKTSDDATALLLRVA